MAYVDKYGKYLEEIPEIIAYSEKTNTYPVFAYTSNLDVVLKWNVDRYNEILEKYLTEEPYAQEGDIISNMQDFARISAAYLIKGLGGNFDITELAVCDCLKEHFQREYSLGGTCAQGAAAIGTMGFPVNVHLTDMSKRVCKMLNHPRTTTIKGTDKVSIMDAVETKPPIYHFILQFDKDDTIIIKGQEYKIPISNRLILFYDTVHKQVPLRKDFFNYWEGAAEHPSSYLMSGFDAIIDQTIMKERIEALVSHIKLIKKKHQDTVIYFEGAFYMNPFVKEDILDALGKYTDIIGMNEEELEELLKRFQKSIDVSKAEDVIKGLDIIINKYATKGIVLHTKDYSMYYGEKRETIEIEKGLTLGNLMSATRARIGKYGTLKDCQDTLKLPLSKAGIAFEEKASKLQTRQELKIVPSRYMEHPKYTIGLGDTFVSGVHICFMK